jgi:hypothetical protein
MGKSAEATRHTRGFKDVMGHHTHIFHQNQEGGLRRR